MVYAAKVIKKDLKQSVYGSFFLMNMFFFRTFAKQKHIKNNYK